MKNNRPHLFFGLLAILLLGLNGCNFFSPGKRRLTRDIRDFAAYISNNKWSVAAKMVDTKHFTWIDDRGRKHRRGALKGFFKSIASLPRRRAFFMTAKTMKQLDPKKIVAVVEMRQQTQEGMIDVGNFIWKSQLVWVWLDKNWKLQRVKDLTRKKRIKSK